MISIKTATEVDKMRHAGSVLKTILAALYDAIKIGVTPKQLDVMAGALIKENNCQSNFKGYYGYPSYICVSVNQQLIHGIPGDTPFKTGDLVSVDAGCIWQGYHSDAAFTKIVSKPNNAVDEQLVNVTKNSLQEAINVIKAGVRVGTVSAAVQNYVELFGFKLPTSYSGHGIGQAMHEDPFIPNVGEFDTGVRLQENMVICVEPMVQIGTAKTRTLSDKWTVVSADGSNTAHFEHTILILKDGCEVLTK